MKLIISKVAFFFIFLAIFLCSSCTFTPWHRQQSELFLNKGISYIEAGKYNNALKELLEAEKYYYGNPKVHYYLGMTYHHKGMKDKAIEEFKEAVSLDKDYSEAHNYLGTLYSDRNLWDQAIEEFDKALSNPIYDTPSIALYNSAWAYYSKKEYKTALAKYQEALNADPLTSLRPQVEKNVGRIYSDQGNISEAIQHFKKSVELDSSLFDAYFLLGQSYLKIKDNKNAKKAFQTVIKLSPESYFGQMAGNYLQSLK
ncbi:MAG: tetratricopeptide repeat protein [Smithella sp.]